MNYRFGGYKSFEITKREIIVSISIISLMLIIGFTISNKIFEYYIDKNEIYNKAVKIESSELFQYGMDTNVGNAFVYGELKAIDTVSYPEVNGKYMYIEKIKEKYTQHTRTVVRTRMVNGKSQSYTTTETYWSWDKVGSEHKKCKEVSFNGVTFNVSKFDIPSSQLIDTIKESSNIRYKYYGVLTSYKGTIFTDLRDKTISNNSSFYANMKIDDTLEYIKSSQTIAQVIFWVVWVALIVIVVILFYKAENEWLE